MKIEINLIELGERILQLQDAFSEEEDFNVWLDRTIDDMVSLYDECWDSIYQYELGDVINLLQLIKEKIKKS